MKQTCHANPDVPPQPSVPSQTAGLPEEGREFYWTGRPLGRAIWRAERYWRIRIIDQPWDGWDGRDSIKGTAEVLR